MPLARLPEPFDHSDWIFEVKYDGFRAPAHLEAGAVRLISRNRNSFKSFPELCRTMVACIEAESAALDGEIVHPGGDGRPYFSKLMRRRSPQHFYQASGGAASFPPAMFQEPGNVRYTNAGYSRLAAQVAAATETVLHGGAK